MAEYVDARGCSLDNAHVGDTQQNILIRMGPRSRALDAVEPLIAFLFVRFTRAFPGEQHYSARYENENSNDHTCHIAAESIKLPRINVQDKVSADLSTRIEQAKGLNYIHVSVRTHVETRTLLNIRYYPTVNYQKKRQVINRHTYTSLYPT